MADTGRPTVMTEEVVAKLEEAFLNGATDREACFIANISKDALYDYCKQYPEFSDRKEDLKDMVKYQARKNIVGEINKGDKTLSQWYLERKVKDEFAQRSEHTGNKGEPLTLNVISYNDQNDNNSVQLSSERLSIGTPESTTEVQDSSVPQTSGQE